MLWRPTLAALRPDDTKAPQAQRVLDLDGTFGLHPLLRPLMPIWQQGHLAPIHACGAPDESRSHFKAMELTERGVEDTHGPASGWINRHLATLDTGNTIHGTWPGLAREQLFGPGDLAVTTDYREVLSEVSRTRLNNGFIDQIFPEFKPTQFGFVREG